ncbi:uncharacterized protein MONOS_18000 [Monocercomonoides exilis]|uniref:uncharacterized protein n=1 Tax=Monocercomonoides exilis TaxID=2049356 RepID=UPI00355ABF96|nr:hypothetical protein MONOS_18000 [Monocercomonoides exilis]
MRNERKKERRVAEIQEQIPKKTQNQKKSTISSQMAEVLMRSSFLLRDPLHRLHPTEQSSRGQSDNTIQPALCDGAGVGGEEEKEEEGRRMKMRRGIEGEEEIDCEEKEEKEVEEEDDDEL